VAVEAPSVEEPTVGSEVRSVVLIEDDRPSLDLMSAYLEGAHWEVSVARDGAEGLSTVRRVEPAVVVLDIRLPRVDGWDVLRALKADPTTASIPVIVVSIVDERAKGLSLGAAEYLVKPVGRGELLDALAAVGVLDRAGGQDHRHPRVRGS
jgi:DNA-binding response OmpR family regulator